MPDRYEVRLTSGAEQDLEAIVDYLTEHASPAIARALLDRMLERIEALERFPERGSIPRELQALGITEFRQLTLPPYRLVYRTVQGKVFVTLIADGRRDMQSLLEQRLLRR